MLRSGRYDGRTEPSKRVSSIEHGGQSISETLAHRSVRRSTGERDEEALGQMRGLIGHGVVPAHTPMPSFLAATAKAGSVLS